MNNKKNKTPLTYDKNGDIKLNISTKEKTNFPVKFVLISLLVIFVVSTLLTAFVSFQASVDGWFTALFVKSEVVRDPLDDKIPSQGNGGLTLEEIQKFRKIDTKPYFDDIFRNFYIRETLNHVYVFREVETASGAKMYPNLIFVKQVRDGKNVLIWDGALGVTVNVGYKNFWERLVNNHDFSNAKISYSMSKDVSYKSNVALSLYTLLDFQENVVTFSDFKTQFAVDFHSSNLVFTLINANREKDKLYNYTREKLVNDILTPYFMNFTDNSKNVSVELIHGDDNDKFSPINLQLVNSYATHLWNESKTVNKDANNAIVSLEDYFDSYIPADLQKNYPMPSNLQKEFGFDNYRMYENTVLGNVFYTYNVHDSILRNENTVEKNTLPYVVAPTPEEVKQYSMVTLSLVNSNNTNLSGLDFKSNPVKIVVNGRQITFDNIKELTRKVAFEKDQQIVWSLTSNALSFNSITGMFTPQSLLVTKEFAFTYTGNFVNFNLKINPLTSLDLNKFKLEQTPVTVIFNGNNQNYTFSFDKNSLLTSGISKSILKGNYNYTIIGSSDLIWGGNSQTGTIEVTATNTNLILNFGLVEPSEYELNLTHTGKSLNAKFLQFLVDIYEWPSMYIPTKVQVFNENLTSLLFEGDLELTSNMTDNWYYSYGNLTYQLIEGNTYSIVVKTSINGKDIVTQPITFKYINTNSQFSLSLIKN